jgi:GDPmannose 4,6-dehydratase
LNQPEKVAHILKQHLPDKIFYLAATHGPANFNYDDFWFEAHTVNTIIPHTFLNFIQREKPTTRLFFLSSSKVFACEDGQLINELSKRESKSIYAITKNAAVDLIEYYREKYDVNASIFFAFNHESPRRSIDYFFPKIIEILSKSIIDPHYVAQIDHLNFWCDWGDASEYMSLVADVADQEIIGNFILATGSTVWTRDFVQKLFSRYSLDYKQHIVELNPCNGIKNKPWRADISSIQRATGRKPMKDLYLISDEILSKNYPESFKHHKRVSR